VTESVGDLIASVNARVYATESVEWDLLWLVETDAAPEKQSEMTDTKMAGVFSAQLEMRRSLARVRLTCPATVVSAAEAVNQVVKEFEDAVYHNVQAARGQGSLDGIERASSGRVTQPLDLLVRVTRKATGYPGLGSQDDDAQRPATKGEGNEDLDGSDVVRDI
jgi:hypothetical protein